MTFIPAGNKRGDSTPRGPARWERAARNALKNPHSKAAQLYRSRYATAIEISEAGRMMSKDGPFEHLVWRNLWQRDRESGRMVNTGLHLSREGVVCSMFCAVMHAQLHVYGPIKEAFTQPEAHAHHSFMRRLETSTLRASVACRVCGRTVRKKA